MVSQRLKTFREVVDTWRLMEKNKEAGQKVREAHANAKGKDGDKGKGKKTLQAQEPGRGQRSNDAKR